MLRLLFVTDTHIRGYAPVNRLDNFQETVFAKLTEVLELAEDLKVDAVIHGGDLFDIPQVAHRLMGRTAGLLRSFPCPIYVVPGNHDLFGYSTATIPHTSLGVLWRAGVVDLLLKPLTLSDGGAPVTIYPIPAAADMPLSAYITGRTGPGYQVVVAHDNLLPSPAHPDIPHKVIGPELSDADLVLAGHWHPGWPEPFISGRTLYVNPGSLVRLDAGAGSRDRQVQVALIVFGPDGLQAEYIPLRTARPFAEVFRSPEGDAGQPGLSALASVLKDEGRPPTVDVFALLERADAPEEVKDLIRKAAAGLERTGLTANWSAEAVRLEEMRVAGFQSHADTVITLASGLNVIVGPSDSGKSALLRALWWLYYNKPRGTEFIKIGENSLAVSVRFADGTELQRKRTRSASGSYEIARPGADPVTLTNIGHSLPPDIVAVHKTPLVELAGEEVSLNIARQFDPPFILGSTNAINLALLDLLTKNDAAFQLIRDLRSREDESKRRYAVVAGDRERTAELLGLTAQVGALAGRIKELAGQYNSLLHGIQRLTAMSDLAQRWQRAKEAVERARSQWEASGLEEKVEQAKGLLAVADGLLDEYRRYEGLILAYNREVAAFRRQAGLIDTRRLSDASEEYAQALEQTDACPLCGGPFPGEDEASKVWSACQDDLDRLEVLLLEGEGMSQLPVLESDAAVRLRLLRNTFESTRADIVAASKVLEQSIAEVHRLEAECQEKFGLSVEELDSRIRELSEQLQGLVGELAASIADLKASYEALAGQLRTRGW